MRAGCPDAGKGEFADDRLAAQPHKIILEVEPARFGAQAGAPLVARHRQQPRTDAEPAAEIVRYRRQALAGVEAAGTLDMRREIAVAEPEPGLAAERFEGRHECPGLAVPPPAEFRIRLPRQRIEQRVEIGRDRQAEMLEIIAGIGDNGQHIRQQDAVQAERELGAPDAAGQRQHRAVFPGHRNRSCSGGRTSATPGASGADHDRPRTSTIGVASAAWPCTSEAAAAISSAKPVSVTSRMRPNRSGWPRQSIIAGSPAAPSAMPTVPRRNGRPKLSLTMTAIRLPTRSARSPRSRSADASGSIGSSSTRSVPLLSSGATFEWSMPALAMT